MLRLFQLISLVVLGVGISHAQFRGGAVSVASVAEIFADKQTIAPGQSVTMALKLSHPAEWHSYYRNSGGVELAPQIAWTLPEGFSAGPIQWPVPEVKDGYFGKSFIYSGSPVFLVDIAVPPDAKVGEVVELKADATWQICKESCINEKKSFEISLPIGSQSNNDPALASLFSAAREKLPKPASNISVRGTGDEVAVTLTVEAPGEFENLPTDFIPNEPFVFSASAGGSIKRVGSAIEIQLKRQLKNAFDEPIPPGSHVSGILIGEPSFLIEETSLLGKPTENGWVASGSNVSSVTLFPILGGMFLGGLLLNLMPCVFPVIGLKIMGFVEQSGHSRKQIAGHGITFTLGVLASFGVLSGILFAARSSVGMKGWGYQLQNPTVILVLMILMLLLALNMFGVFEIGTSATSVGGSLHKKQGHLGSFFSGVLATVVATPCSAPFLGAAIGAAISLPMIQFFTAFGAMAFGLALPYLVLSLFPRLIALLPRPGAWMESFKQAMSFLLFATSGYLLWIYAGQVGLDESLGAIFGLSSIALGAWIYGRWYLPHRTNFTRSIAILLALTFGAGGVLLAFPPAKNALVWEKWSASRVEELLANGTPAYVDFTAQWCATCQVNKKRAYTHEVIAMMKRKGIVALKADKTNPDSAIEAELLELKRTAIPVNVLYVPNRPPVITPELLSPKYLLELFGSLPDVSSVK